MESGNDVGMDAINSTTRARLDNPAYDSTDPASRPGSIQLCQDMIYEYAQVSDSPMGVRVLRHDFSPERYAE
jgi:hypothetical protein